MLSTSRLAWMPKQREFIVEASDIKFVQMDQLYPDACDVGFCVQSHVTGKVLRFFETEQKYNRDGDLDYTKFQIVPEDQRKYPDLADISLIVLND